MSAAKVFLGCRLFFDTRLSSNGAYSCASCHRPELAFTDGRPQSIGVTGELTARGSMSLANLAYNTAYTWASDQARTLEQQMATPLFNTHPIEMGLAARQDILLQALRSSDTDATAFRAAFPESTDAISMAHVIQAIAAFERTLISGRSAFDRYVFDDERTALSAGARRGMALFFSPRTGCSECHSGLHFAAAGAFANTGIQRQQSAATIDHGLMDVTGRAADLGKFRVPTLRNVALTAPYMHDGSIATLQAVVEHYVTIGTQREENPQLDAKLRPLVLDNDERADLVSFLESLSDPEFASGANLPCRAGLRQ
jgi:cytochrome c peroxidase